MSADVYLAAHEDVRSGIQATAWDCDRICRRRYLRRSGAVIERCCGDDLGIGNDCVSPRTSASSAQCRVRRTAGLEILGVSGRSLHAALSAPIMALLGDSQEPSASDSPLGERTGALPSEMLWPDANLSSHELASQSAFAMSCSRGARCLMNLVDLATHRGRVDPPNGSNPCSRERASRYHIGSSRYTAALAPTRLGGADAVRVDPLVRHRVRWVEQPSGSMSCAESLAAEHPRLRNQCCVRRVGSVGGGCREPRKFGKIVGGLSGGPRWSSPRWWSPSSRGDVAERPVAPLRARPVSSACRATIGSVEVGAIRA